jgi:hypothetical protein
MSGGRHPRIGIPWSGGGGGTPAFGALGTISTSGSTGITSQTSTLSNVGSGNLVLALVQRNAQSECTGVTVAGQSMSLLKRVEETAAGFAFDVWGVLASSANSSASVTASYNSSSSEAWGTILSARYSGVASATPVVSVCHHSSCVGMYASGTARYVTPDVTVTEQSLIIATGCDWNDFRTHTPASGWTKRVDGSGTPLTSIQFLHDRVAASGNFGAETNFATTGVSDQYLGAMLVFV